MNLTIDEAKRMNTTALAFIGDAVYEVYVREHVLEFEKKNVDLLHKMAIKYVRADGQALAIKRLMKEGELALDPENAGKAEGFVLTKEEMSLVRRARNHKSASKPKNADPIIYKWATAFEALVGFMKLTGDTDRMEELIMTSIGIIEGKE